MGSARGAAAAVVVGPLAAAAFTLFFALSSSASSRPPAVALSASHDEILIISFGTSIETCVLAAPPGHSTLHHTPTRAQRSPPQISDRMRSHRWAAFESKRGGRRARLRPTALDRQLGGENRLQRSSFDDPSTHTHTYHPTHYYTNSGHGAPPRGPRRSVHAAAGVLCGELPGACVCLDGMEWEGMGSIDSIHIASHGEVK